MTHLTTIIFIMLFAGVFGGVVNYLMLQDKSNSAKLLKNKTFYKSIFLGVAASFLVPLFLNTISSNIIESSEKDIYQLLVFTGFCLIAAISSKTFINSISENMIKELSNSVNNMEEQVGPLIENATERDVNENGLLSNNLADDSARKVEVSDDDMHTMEQQVLGSVANGKYAYRTKGGISKETGIPKAQTHQVVNQLIQKGHLSQNGSNPDTNIYITKKGKMNLK
ncbi:YEATS-associated helix-containing protein [Fusibacter sp. 3D3]|uniref:YEATS-associated helix-containing protein n=1 Tax=Fusibacter sp. 3D3 TaxID=1048380 RepID=UPI000853614E|nr:YEATS-associated helix-containing protein [Fusibacter sp. 3D3]GAU80020.1 hypothetical protein F3D3_4686 [Fusibacter sp. 3D3]